MSVESANDDSMLAASRQFKWFVRCEADVELVVGALTDPTNNRVPFLGVERGSGFNANNQGTVIGLLDLPATYTFDLVEGKEEGRRHQLRAVTETDEVTGSSCNGG